MTRSKLLTITTVILVSIQLCSGATLRGKRDDEELDFNAEYNRLMDSPDYTKEDREYFWTATLNYTDVTKAMFIHLLHEKNFDRPSVKSSLKKDPIEKIKEVCDELEPLIKNLKHFIQRPLQSSYDNVKNGLEDDITKIYATLKDKAIIDGGSRGTLTTYRENCEELYKGLKNERTTSPSSLANLNKVVKTLNEILKDEPDHLERQFRSLELSLVPVVFEMESVPRNLLTPEVRKIKGELHDFAEKLKSNVWEVADKERVLKLNNAVSDVLSGTSPAPSSDLKAVLSGFAALKTKLSEKLGQLEAKNPPALTKLEKIISDLDALIVTENIKPSRTTDENKFLFTMKHLQRRLKDLQKTKNFSKNILKKIRDEYDNIDSSKQTTPPFTDLLDLLDNQKQFVALQVIRNDDIGALVKEIKNHNATKDVKDELGWENLAEDYKEIVKQVDEGKTLTEIQPIYADFKTSFESLLSDWKSADPTFETTEFGKALIKRLADISTNVQEHTNILTG